MALNPIPGTAGNDVLQGTNGDDLIQGFAGNDTLQGLGGNDTIEGGDGSDLLTGGDGADTLTGGNGIDIFRDTAAGLNGDTITDFLPGDRIQITDVGTAGINLTGNTLSYQGGSTTIGNVGPGRFVIRTIDTGGVEIRLEKTAHNDFNGDGRSDILWRATDGTLVDWLGQAGGGAVDNSAHLNAVVPNVWQVVGTGDFDGDGRSDILWRANDGTVVDWLGQANGGAIDNSAHLNVVVPNVWHVAGTGDFNGDGRSDILWRADDGTVVDWLGQAGGGAADNSSHLNVVVPNVWHIVGTGDFNGDGHDDILWRADDGTVVDWLGQDNGGFADNSMNFNVVVPNVWHVIGTGDFNGDGRDDILWRANDGTTVDWLGQANGSAVDNSAHLNAVVPTLWHVAGTGDFNGDAIDDILWRANDGTTVNWLGQSNGGFADNSTHLDAVVPNVWHVQDPFVAFL